VGRAVSSLELAHAGYRSAEAATPAQRLAQVEVPAECLSAVVGPGGEAIAEVRALCGGIMIALQPSEKSGGPMTAFIGPSDPEQVARAERAIRERMLLAEAAAEAETATAAAIASGTNATAVAGGTRSPGAPAGEAGGAAGAEGPAEAAGAAEAEHAPEDGGAVACIATGSGAESDGLEDIP